MRAGDYLQIIKEYHISWLCWRLLYAGKIKLLCHVAQAERFFKTGHFSLKTEHFSLKTRHSGRHGKKGGPGVGNRDSRLDMLSFDIRSLQACVRGLGEADQERLLRQAGQAAEGKITAFSSRLLDYGSPIRWNVNPVTGCPVDMRLKWYEIPDFDPKRGDIKVIWEASRLTHFYVFARAYLLTGDERYYRAFSAQLGSWLERNPSGYGPNYKCGQECGLRMINAWMVYSIFKECGCISPGDKRNMEELIRRCYRKICSDFFYARRCIRNNHTLSELCGMILGAWCFGEEARLKKAYRWLNEEIRRQFFADGGYRQYSYTYQRLALQLMEFVLKIEPLTGYGLEKENRERLAKSAAMLYQLQNEDGDVPNYGSNDGALIFPVHSCSYRDFRPVVDGIMKGIKGKSLYPPGAYEEEALWFLPGKSSAAGEPAHHLVNESGLFSARFSHSDALGPNHIQKELWRPAGLERKSRIYPDCGCYMMRRGNTMAVLYHQSFDSRPAQMDQLHLDLWVQGVNVLCDSGTYSYAEEEGKKLALTGSHNTVKVKGTEQMRKTGAFLIYGWPRRKILAADENRFCGRMVSVNGYAHQRDVSYKGQRILIRDTVEVIGRNEKKTGRAGCDPGGKKSQMQGKKAEHRDGKYGFGPFPEYRVLFHTPCKVRKNGDGLDLLWEGNVLATLKSDSRTIKTRPCYRSLFYLQKESITEIYMTPGKGETVTEIVIAKETDG